MQKNKPIVLVAGSILLGLILVVGIMLYILFHKELQIIGTIEKLNNEGLYTMEYAGDYGLNELLNAGGVSSSSELATFVSTRLSKGLYTHRPRVADYGCSTISAVNAAGDQVFGRNFDWENCTTMVVTAIPNSGYKSVSTVNLDFLGYGGEYQPESLFSSFLALAAPLVPLDGMNEKGLCVADLVVQGLPETQQNTEKPDVTTTIAIRLLLDNASTVDEAIAILEQYDMHSDIDTMHHIAICDSTGKSVVVEYLNNKMFVTDTHIITNFILTEGVYYGTGSDGSKARYDVLEQLYLDNGGFFETDDIKDALMAVSQTNGGFDSQWNTPWSIVYNQSTLELTLYHRENYSHGYTFSVEERSFVSR